MAEPEVVPDGIVPYFQNDVLPPGDYRLTIAQLRASHLITGFGNSSKS